jgi:hypothetical protein
MGGWRGFKSGWLAGPGETELGGWIGLSFMSFDACMDMIGGLAGY